MQDFRQLQVWQKAHQLTLDVYQITRQFPSEELYSLTSQMCRSASSIPTNIAEGCGRGGTGEMRRFLQIAMGSASELQYQIILAHDLNFIDLSTHRKLEQEVSEVKRMLTGLLKKLTTEN